VKVLFLSTWFPYPPDNGARIRVSCLIKALSQKHNVFLISLLQDDSHPEDVQHLQDMCTIVSLHKNRWFAPSGIRNILGFFSFRPRHMTSSYDPGIRSAVARAITDLQPDILIASEFIAMDYVSADAHIPIIFEEFEVGWLHRQASYIHNVAKLRWYLTFAKWRTFARHLLNCADLFTCVSCNELELISGCYHPSCPGVIIPNGVDTGRYTPASHVPEQGFLLYNGAPTYGPNLDSVRCFAQDIYPILVKHRPDAILHVTGRIDGLDLRDISICPGIRFTGYIKDMRDILRRSSLLAVPLRQGGGSRLKILEAMAAGVPVVSTSIGAEGLDVVNGRHLLIADSPGDFVNAIVHILNDSALAGEMSDNARRLVEERYSWSIIGKQFTDLVEATASAGKRR